MSPSKLHEWVDADPERARIYAQEALIVDVAEEIWAALSEVKMTKAELAAKLGKSKAFVTQVLDGSRNMTLRTLADIACAIEREACVRLMQKNAGGWKKVSPIWTRRGPLMGVDIKPSNDSSYHKVTALRLVKTA